MRIWRPFYIQCSGCGHRNRPDKSPREGVRLALTGQLSPCRNCGKELHPRLSERPLVQRVREELRAQGIAPVC